MTRGFKVFIPLLFLIAAPSIHSQTPSQLSRQFSSGQNADARALIQQMVNSVSADNIVNNIRGLQGFGSRYEYFTAQETAADWIIKELDWWGVKAASQWFKFGSYSFWDIEMVDRNVGYIVGPNLLATTDCGATWGYRTSQGVPAGSYYLYGINFPTRQTGWIVGTNGLALKTVDGGNTWVWQNFSSSYQMYDVEFANVNLGIIVGANGTILRTSNAGATWNPVSSGSQYSLWQVRVIDSLNSWTVGSGGTILHSSDGGRSWQNQYSGVTEILYGVDFIDPKVGWVVGAGRRLLKTTDGGAHWNRESLDYSSREFCPTLYGVSFADSVRGWITDTYGGVWSTTDAGQSWRKTNPANRYGWVYLRRIKAFQDNHVIICGSDPNIVLSTDGGTTWSPEGSNLPSIFQHTSRNIVVTIPGTVTPQNECVMLAHYDCASQGPGADDNASGTSAIMEAARILKNYQFESTITLIAVSGEELGMKGSAEYTAQAKNAGRNIIGVVNADMIGYPIRSDTSRLVVLSFVVRNRLIDSAVVYNYRYGIGARIETATDSTGATDYSPFAMAGYDAIDVSEGTPQDIWTMDPYYHTAHDSLDKLHPGLMRRAAQLMLTTIAEIAKPIAKVEQMTSSNGFVLEQNFPNPFNSQTVLRFKIPQSAFVKLKVFDVLGREVATVFQGDLEAGAHSFNWKADHVSSGLYFCQLRAGSFRDTKRMTLLK